jgi:hypothetical protein
MTKKLFWPILFFVSILLSACSTFQTVQYPADSVSAQCLPSFPDQDGWYGGDGAYSIALDGKRTLWLFGDSFVSQDAGRKDRIGMDVVLGTTVAISTCSGNTVFNIQYYIKKKDGAFVSSFGDKEWLWPQDPFIVNSVLYIPLLEVAAIPGEKAPFNFKIAGHRIARIDNYSAKDPHQWRVKYLDLTQSIPDGIIALATTSLVYHSYVYFYPLYRYTKDTFNISGNVLARIPIDKLDTPTDAIEYLNKEGGWDKKLHPARTKIVLEAGVSELSIRYHADDKKWIAVYLSTTNNGNQFLYQAANVPEGPWSAPLALNTTITEVSPQSSLYDKNNFCYAGKEHIQYAKGKNLVVTYVCNSLDNSSDQSSFIRKNLFLYRPVVNQISY